MKKFEEILHSHGLQIDKKGFTTARKLHKVLGLNISDFARWRETEIVNEKDFKENEDYFIYSTRVKLKNNRNVKRTDYRINTKIVKYLCMVSMTPIGNEVRNYFIDVEEECEKQGITLEFGNYFKTVEDKSEVIRLKALDLLEKGLLGEEMYLRILNLLQNSEI